ncbi:MAG: class I SAM-dependent methyltransferase [Bdellovibrionaceae bacterium]|nr:class I SAM-dependent methyltransferase [Pseudobdellovibrionaceae bacterium]
MKVKNTLEPDGERMIPEFHKGMLLYGEHLLRYQSVEPLVKEKIVLDIASGSGYGSALLSHNAKKVYGVDVSGESIEYAKKNYPGKNIEYLEGSGTDIPIKDMEIDVAVSHETIEHIEDYKKFLSEIKRILKSDGIFVVSTPNDKIYQQDNHFHLHQFSAKELEKVLKKYFKNVKFYYQGVWLTSGLFEKKNFEEDFRQLRSVDKWVNQDVEKAVYFIAVCSDESINEVNITEGLAISEPWTERQQRYIQNSLDERGRAIEHLEGVLHLRDTEIVELKKSLNAKPPSRIKSKFRHNN